MTNLSPAYQRAITLGLPLLIIGLMIGLVYSPAFSLQPEALSFGITVDLLVTLPLVYFLLIRKQRIPKLTVVSIFVVGMVIAGIILPTEQQWYLNLAKTWVLPLIELSVLSFVVIKVRQIMKCYRGQRGTTTDFYTAVKQATTATVPHPFASVLATEIALLYYGFFRWKKRTLAPHEFSYHKNSGSIAILATVLLLVVVETLVVHLLLARWSSVAAWIFSGISGYTAMQIFGVMRSLSQRPIALESDTLIVRYGFLSEAAIPLDNIATVEQTTQPIASHQHTRVLSPLGDLEPHNVLIRLHTAQLLHVMYGAKRTFTTLALHVDEAERLVEKLNEVRSHE